MKTNNIASYSDALVACMRQNPIWILLAEVRSAEAVMAVRNSISSGHHIISTIHADKASSIPMRMYALLEGSQDIDQYLSSIHRYVQIGIYVKGYYSKALDRFQREIMEICEFYVDDETNAPKTNILYSKTLDGKVTLRNPTKKLIDYLAIGNVYFENDDIFGIGDADSKEDSTGSRDSKEDNLANKKAVVSGNDPFNLNGDAAQNTQQATTSNTASQQQANVVQAKPATAVSGQSTVPSASPAIQQPSVQKSVTTPSTQPTTAPQSIVQAQPAPAPQGAPVQQPSVSIQPAAQVQSQVATQVVNVPSSLPTQGAGVAGTANGTT